MRTVLGIAIELFEYNTAWRSSVLFLAFFIITIASLNMLEKPTIRATLSEAGKAVELVANQNGLPEETQEKAKNLMERAKDKYQAFKDHRAESNSPEKGISTQFDREPKPSQNQVTQPEPTTLETLNEL